MNTYPARDAHEARIQLRNLERDQIGRLIEVGRYYEERRRLVRLALGSPDWHEGAEA
jgi:hypothetical protein